MKTVIDLDSELVNEAASVFGTKTKKDTIHAALAEAVSAARRRQQRQQLLLDGLGSPDLGDPDVMAGAWR